MFFLLVIFILVKEVKTTMNIEAYVEWFNRLSYLVATEICVVRSVSSFKPLHLFRASLYMHAQSDRQRNRVKVMEFFVDVANECSKLYNFNSYMAIAGEKNTFLSNDVDTFCSSLLFFFTLYSWTVHESSCQTQKNRKFVH